MIAFDPHRMTLPLDDLAMRLRSETDAPAVVIEVQRDGRAAQVATGVSDLASGVAARADQTFDIGSQAKMMTAVVVLQLAEEGRIELDAAASRWLPASVVEGLPNAGAATVRQLLAMTSGVPDYTEAVNSDGLPLFIEALLQNPGRIFGPEDAFAIARGMPATGAPGAGHYYTNTGYALLGALIEAVTGRELADVLDARIFTPVGMTATSARPFGADDPRLSSYAADPVSGVPIDVTDAPWRLRGEGGVISTTTDLIAFLEALLVDRSLLGADALAAMTDFREDVAPGVTSGFGLGLARLAFDDGPELVGFTGETLGTASSTYLDVTSGTFVSIAGTTPGLNSQDASVDLADAVRAAAEWTPAEEGRGPVRIATGSAADLGLERGPEGVALTLAGASLVLDRTLAQIAADGVRFADGSVLAIGDRSADDIAIGRDAIAAVRQDNQLLGRGGDDRLAGGLGADRIAGGKGDDRLRGRDGEDRLHGGTGDDRLSGGAGDDRLWGGLGSDHITGGSGEDVFVFRSADAIGRDVAGRDVIRDFEPGVDRIDLAAIDAVPGGADDAFGWLGTAAFGGEAGELRLQSGNVHSRLQGDRDGDGVADFSIALVGQVNVGVDDLIL